MSWIKKNLEISVFITILSLAVGATIYLTSIKSTAQTNVEDIKQIQKEMKEHEDDYKSMRDAVIETNMTVKYIKEQIDKK